MPNTSKGQKSLQLGNARYSDPGSTAADRQESTDVTLSGELEDLNNHLDAARAMFNGGAAAGLHVHRARHDAPGRLTVSCHIVIIAGLPDSGQDCPVYFHSTEQTPARWSDSSSVWSANCSVVML